MNRKMKESGIEWIGEIPEEWEVLNNRYLLDFVKGKNPTQVSSDRIGLPYIGASDLEKNGDIHEYENYCNEDLPLASREDTLILWDGARAGLIGIGHEGYISSTIIKVIPKVDYVDKKFWFWYLKGFQPLMNDWVGGTTIPHMNRKFINDIYFLRMPIQNQQKIANFLDQKCFEIDHILEKTRESIEEYKKLKQSIITEAVTKGLNRNVEMKESGVEWIGEIPRHWEVRKIKHLFDTVSGATPKSDNSSYWDGNVVWITPADYKTEDVYIRDSNRKITLDGLNSCATKIAPIGSIVVSNRAPIGQIGLTAVELSTNQGCKTLIKKDRNIISKFVYYFLSVMSIPLNMLGRGTTFLELSTFDLSNFNIQMCSVDEQQQICEYLDLKCSEIDSLINQKETLLTDLEAYKKSLIFECVTGKREVEESFIN